MNINEIEKIIPKEKILQNVQMKKYTSFKIGGEAEVLIKISTLEELTKIIKYITDFENIDKKTIMGLINKIEVIDSETIKIYYKFSE